MADLARQQNEPKALGWCEARFVDLAMQDNELLPQEGVLGNELGFTAG